MKRLTTVAAGLLFVLPLVTSAATVQELQAQAQALLNQIAALQSQLGGTTQVTTAGVAATSASCPLIGRILYIGDSGEDVTRLQQFLARDAAIYPEALSTGYYGSLTEAAVKRWQTQHNIVSSGTAASTGFGQVGPRTAAAMSLQCSTGSAGGPGTPGAGGTPVQGVASGFIQVAPISGAAPLSVKVTATVNTAGSCSGAVYALNWGDGTVPNTITVPLGQCNPVVQNYGHLYIYGGVYTITLSSGQHSTSATVVVSGAGAPSTGGGSSNSQQTFKASATSGTAPFTVTFTGTVTGANAAWCAGGCSNTLDFGDGSTGTVPLPTSQSGAQSYSLSHTYAQAGTYTATLYQGARGASQKVGSSIDIAVSQGAYPPFSLSPNVGGNPLAVTVQFTVAGCPAFSLDWGDGAGFNAGGTACTSTNPSYSHIYGASGSYTVKLVRGSQTDTAAITITN